MNYSLDPKIIKKVSEHVYQRFPEVSGVKPNIRKQTPGQISKHGRDPVEELQNFLLTYRGSVNLANGKKMDRWVRVVVNSRGKIIKMTTSR